MNAHTYYLAVILSHIESWYWRIDHLVSRVFTPPASRSRGEVCPLCDHQLGAREQRPPRDVRRVGGQVKRLPEEVLVWRRCGGCGLHQTGARA